MSKKDYGKEYAERKGNMHNFWNDRKIKTPKIKEHSDPITEERGGGWFTSLLNLIKIVSRADEN